VQVLGKNNVLEDVHLLLGTTSRLTVEQLLNFIALADIAAIPQFFQRQLEKNFDALSFNRKVFIL
jgi:hypothetical protein